MAECLWCFLLEGFEDDPVAEDENGDIKPVFLMVELNEPMTASTCIILDTFGQETIFYKYTLYSTAFVAFSTCKFNEYNNYYNISSLSYLRE